MESPAKKRKTREQPSTPVRRVLVESVVERSPAVAVSVNFFKVSSLDSHSGMLTGYC